MLAVLGGGVLVPLLVVHRHDIGAALALLVTVCPAWLSVAALAEAVSYLTRGGALRAVLRGAAPTVGTAALAAITVVGDAVAYVLPFGFAAGGAVAVGQTHRRGAPRAAAVWGFAVVTLVGMAVLVALGVVAAGVAVVAAGPGALPSGPGLLAVAAVVVVVAAAVAVGRRRRARRDGQAQRHARWDGATSLRARRNGLAQPRTRWHGAASLRARRDGQAQFRTRWPGATSLRARWDGLAQPGVRREGATQPSRWSGALLPRASWSVAARPHVAAGCVRAGPTSASSRSRPVLSARRPSGCCCPGSPTCRCWRWPSSRSGSGRRGRGWCSPTASGRRRRRCRSRRADSPSSRAG